MSDAQERYPGADADPNIITLALDAFVRSVGVRRTGPLSLFLGAGASVSSGLPSAEMCIWEWKRRIFLTNNPGLEEQFAELSLPGIRRRIQKWLDAQGHFPPAASPNEYGFYIQRCFPIAEDRRAYFQGQIRAARPHVGYQLLCHLAEADIVREVWSTNFDGLAARAAAPFDLTPLEVGFDTQKRLTRPPAPAELLCVSLHGDYRYDALKNTPGELQSQEATLCEVLVETTRTRDLVVTGYSGRDRSVMDTLRAGYAQPGPGSLFWCGFGDGEPPDDIAALVSQARAVGRNAHYVPTHGFDDLITRLALHCLQGDQRVAARRSIAASVPKDAQEREPFRIPPGKDSALIKSNAFEIECPTEVLEFDLKAWPTERVWAWLREATHDRPLIAVPLRGVLALGTIEDIHDAFGNNLKGPIERTPVGKNELRYEDGAMVSLMQEALVRSMAEAGNVRTDGRRMLWRPNHYRRVRRGGVEYAIHEAVRLYLRRIDDTQHLVLLPTLKVFDENAAEPAREVADQIKVDILGYQHNGPFNRAVNGWRETLFPKSRPPVFAFPPQSGSTFKFRVRAAPVFAMIDTPSERRTLRLPDRMRALVKHRGVQLAEPMLLFSNKGGTGQVRDAHPIRGILNNRPYDFALTATGVSPTLRVGVVCPQAEASILHRYLASIERIIKPGEKERDYLLDYPGFTSAYGLPVEWPTPESAGWVTCPEPSTRDRVQGSHEAARLVGRSIERLVATHLVDVVLVYVPDRWEPFRGYSSETESFDLHNFIKAFCVQRGISSQFLNEDTVSGGYQCRVWWWLSLALYVKGMRTPWLLDGLAENTAFVGLGFSIDRNAPRGDHVVLGCSHIYSGRGEGLQYRLSKIENPIIRRGNPFMSADDARRVGETIRQLFFDARMKLPERVVLHKRTPFTKNERDGLGDGLGGIGTVDMLEIQIDHSLRYVASVQKTNRAFDEDNYPVRRGTAMKLDDYSALVWVHGATTALDARRKYFQGKRRIPAPLVVRRHAGRTPLPDIAREIVGLSKMNWNTFDLYTKLPATLQSSGEIARIGSLLQRFGTESYDYRLFI